MTTSYNTASQNLTDTLGVQIRVGDMVTVTSWGAPVRLADAGRRCRVVRITNRRLVVLDDPDHPGDPVARGRSVSPGCLAVARRDGQSGHEGNR